MLKHGKKRILSILLAIAMVLALVPLTATPALAAVTGTLSMSEDEEGLDLAIDHSGVGWTWTA
jgi:hypothetical protein